MPWLYRLSAFSRIGTPLRVRRESPRALELHASRNRRKRVAEKRKQITTFLLNRDAQLTGSVRLTMQPITKATVQWPHSHRKEPPPPSNVSAAQWMTCRIPVAIFFRRTRPFLRRGYFLFLPPTPFSLALGCYSGRQLRQPPKSKYLNWNHRKLE